MASPALSIQAQLRDQLERDIPQPLRIIWIDGIGSNTATEICRTLGDPWGLVAVLEIEAADAVEQRRGGEEHGSRGALLGSLTALDWRLQTASVLLQARRDRARIHSVAGNALV